MNYFKKINFKLYISFIKIVACFVCVFLFGKNSWTRLLRKDFNPGCGGEAQECLSAFLTRTPSNSNTDCSRSSFKKTGMVTN